MFARLIPNAAAHYDASTQCQQCQEAEDLGFIPDMESNYGQYSGMSHQVCRLNILGYIPLVSIFTGLYRTLVGLAYLIVSIARAIFDAKGRNLHKESIKIALANMGRGLLEMIPVVGNILAFNIDASRMLHRWKEHKGDRYGVWGGEKCLNDFLDNWSAIPILGRLEGVVRTIFSLGHVLVNLPGAMVNNKNCIEAVEFGAEHVMKGILGTIPFVGMFYARYRIAAAEHALDM